VAETEVRMLRRIISVLVLIPLAAVIVALAVANRHGVTLSFDPTAGTRPALALTLPLFVVLFATLLAGVVIGGVAAWLRQRRWRRSSRRYHGEVHRLRAENDTLRKRVAEAESRPISGHPAPALLRRLPAA
jgi:uncharacterized integral membrane protein